VAAAELRPALSGTHREASREHTRNTHASDESQYREHMHFVLVWR